MDVGKAKSRKFESCEFKRGTGFGFLKNLDFKEITLLKIFI